VYPKNIQDFHNDMPQIADKRDSRDISLLMDNHSRDININTVSLSAKTKVNQESDRIWDDPKYAHMIKEIQNHLLRKLNKGLLLKSKQAYRQIPWKQLKREDLVNWPNDVRLGQIKHQGKQSLVKLYNNLDRIDFTKEFLDDSKRRPNKDPEIKQIRSEIQNKLLVKLNAGLKTKFISIPWSLIRREDLVNWPNNVPLNNIDKLGIEHLGSLHEHLDLINFTQEFFDRYASKPKDGTKEVNIKDTSLVSVDNQIIDSAHTSPHPIQKDRDLNINKVSLSAKTKFNQKKVRIRDDPKYARMIKEIQNDLLQKLSKGRLLKSKQAYKQLPWNLLKREDFVNWPSDVRLGRIIHQGRQSLVKLYSNLDRIDFTKEFLDRYASKLKD
jgi:hypothetical protein